MDQMVVSDSEQTEAPAQTTKKEFPDSLIWCTKYNPNRNM